MAGKDTLPRLPVRYQIGESVSLNFTVKMIRFTEDGPTYDLIAEDGSRNIAFAANVSESLIRPGADPEIESA
jgi:hypothetical protein